MRFPSNHLRCFAGNPRRLWSGRSIVLATTLALCLAPVLLYGIVESKSPKREVGSQRTTKTARLSERVSIHAADRGNPAINLSDGHDLLTSYVGPEELRVALE